MRLRNCARCGTLFASPGGQELCARCVREDQEDFEKVRKYLKENPRAALLEVSQATGVSVPRIKEYIRQGRLALSTEGDEGLTCERCGRPISTGRFCERCARGIAQALRAAGGRTPKSPSPAPSPPSGDGKGRVHLADRIRKKR